MTSLELVLYSIKLNWRQCKVVFGMAIYHTGGVFSYLPHHLDLALEDSVGHSAGLSWG